MSWLYSRALVAEYLQGNCLDGELSALLNSTPTPQAYCAPDKMTAFSRPSQFGMTFAPLTATDGAELLTWFLAGFPARTSAALEKGWEFPARGPSSGGTCTGLFARYDHGTYTWKTPQLSLLAGSELYSGTWPRWGTMLNGECWARQMWERRTRETESGLWPTCTVHGNYNQKGMSKHSGTGLATAVRMWPTPNVPNGGRRVPDNAEIRGGNSPTAYLNGKKMQVGLEQAVKWWPTPTKSDGCGGPGNSGRAGGMNLRTAVRYMTPTARMGEKSGGRRKGKADTLPSQIAEMEGMDQTSTGQLNPTWVEWLMGWPLGWTDLQPLEMDRCQPARQKHSAG